MLALIPARGGSKGVPGKNIKLLGGKPLIWWTIEAAIHAKYVDRVVLSTDSQEIADACSSSNIEIPFLRPSELAQDDSLAIDAYIYTMDRMIKEFGYSRDEFIVLLPTVPFRNSNDIDASIELFRKTQADSVISCKEMEHPLDWVFHADEQGRIIKDSPAKMENRQAAGTSYLPNGGVYVFRLSKLKEFYSYYSEKTFSYVMPAERSIDIDTEADFKYSEWLTIQRSKDAK